jgi:predicted MFS family arabinose efflux permease
VLLVVVGCGGPALTGALSSRLGEIVPAAQLSRAFGIDAATYGVAGVAGPALAAAAAALWSPTVATLVLAGCAVAGALVVVLLPVRVRPSGARPPRMRDGMVAIGRSRPLLLVTVTTTLGETVAGVLPVAAVVVAQAAGLPDAAGWLVTALSAGALLGSLGWAWRPAAPEHLPRVLVVALVGVAVPLVVAAVLPPVPVVMGLLFALSGIADGPLVGAMFASRQQHSPAPVRGQVFTIAAGLRSTAAAGGAALAGLVAGLGPAVVLGLAAVFPLTGALGVVAFRRWSEAGLGAADAVQERRDDERGQRVGILPGDTSAPDLVEEGVVGAAGPDQVGVRP